MAIDFRRVRIKFDPTSGQEQKEAATVVFSSRVLRAEAALNGFDVQYTDQDRWLKRQIIDVLEPTILNNNTVTVKVHFLLRDNTGNIDDRYNGYVDVLVIADVA